MTSYECQVHSTVTRYVYTLRNENFSFTNVLIYIIIHVTLREPKDNKKPQPLPFPVLIPEAITFNHSAVLSFHRFLLPNHVHTLLFPDSSIVSVTHFLPGEGFFHRHRPPSRYSCHSNTVSSTFPSRVGSDITTT